MYNFNLDKKRLLSNPPQTIKGWVVRVSEYGNKTVTKGKKYKVMGHFKYLNTYGEKGWKYPKWDEFITIKNDNGYTVKMNFHGFKPCATPMSSLQKIEKRVQKLESVIAYKGGINE